MSKECLERVPEDRIERIRGKFSRKARIENV